MEVYTAQDQHFNYSKFSILNFEFGRIGKSYVLIYISLLLKIRWGIHIKKSGHIFKGPFPKILSIYQ